MPMAMPSLFNEISWAYWTNKICVEFDEAQVNDIERIILLMIDFDVAQIQTPSRILDLQLGIQIHFQSRSTSKITTEYQRYTKFH